MDLEDFDLKKKEDFQIGADLSAFSIEELQKLAAALDAEIERINGAIERKEAELQSAHSIFKS